MKKKKNTEFYLLRKKDLSEGDLFITDYTKTKQRVICLENELEILKLRLNNKDLLYEYFGNDWPRERVVFV
jgi:hypothetical protein